MALFGQVDCQVSQVKDQVGQGQGQELDNYGQSLTIIDYHGLEIALYRVCCSLPELSVLERMSGFLQL